MVIGPVLAEDKKDPTLEAWIVAARRAQEEKKNSKYADAAESAKQALRLAKHFGPLDSKLGSTYHLLGIIYRDWGHCAESRTNYKHAIAIWLQLPQPNPRYVFNSITSLVSVECECDDFAGAEKTYRAYQPELRHYRSNSLDDAQLLSLEAVLARGRKDYARSETLFRQSIEMMEKSPDVQQVELAVQRSSLSVVLEQEGRHADSLAESEHAITFLEHAAPLHHSLLAAINNAACSLAELGRRDESERMFQRALALAAQMYGEENRVTAKIMLSYARVLGENKESPAAADFRKKGIEAFRSALRRDNGTVDVEDLRKK
jgi:tetratricopeptide (TPR) repeat protein